MATTATTMETEFRLFVQDSDTSVSADFTSAQVLIFLNYALMWMYENYEKRAKMAVLSAVYAAGAYNQDGDSTVLYPEILKVFIRRGDLGAGTTEDFPLIPMEWGELANRQAVLAAAGEPSHVAFIKLGGAGLTAGLQNKWKFALYPITTDAKALWGLVRDNPTQLTTGTDIVDLDDFGARIAVLIAVVLAARIKGAPDLADNAMQLLPKMIQDKLASRVTHDEARVP